MDRLKSIRWLSIGIYLVVLLVAYYIYFGVGILPKYEALEWEGVKTQVPDGFKTQTYQHSGWSVYSLKKIFVLIKVAVRPAFDVTGLLKHHKKLMYRSLPVHGINHVLFLAKKRKQYEMVYAETVGDRSVYVSVESGSVYAAQYILNRIIDNAQFNGEALNPPAVSIPTGKFATDIFFAVGMGIPLILILAMFFFMAKIPAEKHFSGDPLRFGERNVYFKKKKGLSRKTGFCYLALTSTRLISFIFGRPVFSIELHQEKGKIRFNGKAILIEKEGTQYSFYPKEIDQWRSQLSMY